MKTSLDCMPCFMKMALQEARLACPGDEDMHAKVVAAWGRLIGQLDLNNPPPDLAGHLSALVRSITGCGDLYLEDKRQANDMVLGMLPGLTVMLEDERKGGDSLELALELSIIGNFIDRGVELDCDFEQEISNVSSSIQPSLFLRFKEECHAGANVLILGDNTGEIVLDMLLVQELTSRGCSVTYAVRSRHAINDSTMEDAEYVGMTKLCEVVESGVDTPGTVLSRCTPEFLERMKSANVIISKGQGNFEALDGEWPGVYCAFKVKCKRIAQETGLPLGATVFGLTRSSENHDAPLMVIESDL